MSDLEICFLTATEMGHRLRTKDLVAEQGMDGPVADAAGNQAA
jgi:hypothetical protein